VAEPTTAEAVAAELGVPVRELERLRKLPRSSVSLDAPLAGTRFTLADTVADPYSDSPEHVVEVALLCDALKVVLSELTEREQEIVRCRFGLDGSRPQTLEEIGRSFGVTRERIRQIEAKSMEKLKHPKRRAKLLEFIGEPSWAVSAGVGNSERKGR
jgi:RNA polymerase primary sigma factor